MEGFAKAQDIGCERTGVHKAIRMKTGTADGCCDRGVYTRKDVENDEDRC